MKFNYKYFFLSSIIFIFSCSASSSDKNKTERIKVPGIKGLAQRVIPWGKTGFSEKNETDSDYMNESEMEVEQLYGLHTKQGAELTSHQKDIDFLNSKIDSIGSDVSLIMSMLKNMQDDMKITKDTPDTTSVNVVSEMAQMQMKVKLNKDRVDKYTMFFDSVRFDMNQKYVILDNEVSTLRKALVEYMSSNTDDYNVKDTPKMSDAEYRNLYSEYYRFYINEDYDSSIEGFKDLLLADKTHDLSENCQYWMGEAYFAKGEYDIALETFKRVFNFPNEKKEDDAQLKIGICYIKLGDNSKAKKELQNYIDQYPRGEFVSKAKSYLTQLD
tara:strand:- start:44 stop:1027 length:984 start_codon:yes stop_codon:yes gene_type:complete